MNPEITYSFAKRWTPEVEPYGFTPVSNFFLTHYHQLEPEPLSHGEAMFVVHLMQYKWDSEAPFPNYATLSKRMGVSPKSARRYAQSLQNKGYLFREQRKGRSNLFNLNGLFKALASFEPKASVLPKAKNRYPEQASFEEEALFRDG